MRWLTGGGVVVLFPFMARGHINPFLDLAHLLSARYPSLCLTLLTTSGNLPLFRRLPHPPSLRFAVLPFCPSDHGLPPDADSTFALPPHLVSRIYHAAEASLPPSFRALLMDLLDDEDEASPPLLCLIADMFLAWTVPIAEELGVFQATLYTSGPFAMSMYNSIWINLPHADGREGDDDEIAVPGLPGVTVRRRQLSPNMRSVTSTDHPASQFVRRQAEFCHRSRATLWNTAEIIEKPYLEQWARSMNQPVYAVGPLFAAASVGARRAATDDYGGLAAECLAWLDERAPKSVVYVSFGSQNRMPPEEMVELLAALEKQSRPFLWAAPAADQAPPPEATTAGGGLVARGWVPQAEILAHEAVGAFMSHGGWNSVLESLRFGVPVVIRPLGAEQFCNAKLVVEVLGAGAEASVGAKALEAVAEVMGDGERGKEVRRRASEIAAGLAAAVAEANAGGADGVGPSLCALDEFIKSVTM
ncbi:UDP-glycosyltransferase 92A1-like [Zingiber officinale]|uniref:UDP-glycosyltransferase 92A1-like n=1 Tax=Zingiber officinale TaxID=94328 RepID=UPI001C4CEF30|nr:UDP-glycosyltransferase 92A1-like [Zingiber officinale]